MIELVKSQVVPLSTCRVINQHPQQHGVEARMHLFGHLQASVQMSFVGKILAGWWVVAVVVVVIGMGGGEFGPTVAKVLRPQSVTDMNAIKERVDSGTAAVVGELQGFEEGGSGIGKLEECRGICEGVGGGGCTPTTPTPRLRWKWGRWG